MTEHELHLTSAPYWLIPAERTKNGRSSVVPLPATAVKIISEALQRVMRGEFVFPARRLDPMAYDGNHVSRECKALFRSLGVGDMRLHDLRHQAATGMAQCGVPLDIRQLVQNQISGRQQRIGSRYDQHDYLQEKRRALELWERRLLAVVEDREIPNERY